MHVRTIFAWPLTNRFSRPNWSITTVTCAASPTTVLATTAKPTTYAHDDDVTAHLLNWALTSTSSHSSENGEAWSSVKWNFFSLKVRSNLHSLSLKSFFNLRQVAWSKLVVYLSQCLGVGFEYSALILHGVQANTYATMAFTLDWEVLELSLVRILLTAFKFDLLPSFYNS